MTAEFVIVFAGLIFAMCAGWVGCLIWLQHRAERVEPNNLWVTVRRPDRREL